MWVPPCRNWTNSIRIYTIPSGSPPIEISEINGIFKITIANAGLNGSEGLKALQGPM